MTKTVWKRQWNSWIARTRYPGVYRRRDGGHLVRALVSLPNGDRPEIKETYPETKTDGEAHELLLEAKQQLLEAYQREQESSASPVTVDSLEVTAATVATAETSTAMVVASRPSSLVLHQPEGTASVNLATAPVTIQDLEAVL